MLLFKIFLSKHLYIVICPFMCHPLWQAAPLPLSASSILFEHLQLASLRFAHLFFVNYSAQDASIFKISVPIRKRSSWRFQNTHTHFTNPFLTSLTLSLCFTMHYWECKFNFFKELHSLYMRFSNRYWKHYTHRGRSNGTGPESVFCSPFICCSITTI